LFTPKIEFGDHRKIHGNSSLRIVAISV